MVSSLLKNISQFGSFPQVGVKIRSIWNHHLECDSHLAACVGMFRKNKLLMAEIPNNHLTSIFQKKNANHGILNPKVGKIPNSWLVRNPMVGGWANSSAWRYIYHINWWSPAFWFNRNSHRTEILHQKTAPLGPVPITPHQQKKHSSPAGLTPNPSRPWFAGGESYMVESCLYTKMHQMWWK